MGAFSLPAASLRASPPQRNYVRKLLSRHGYLDRRETTMRTSAQWRPLFKVIGNEPELRNDMPDFPTVDEFVDSLTVQQASGLINYLLEQ